MGTAIYSVITPLLSLLFLGMASGLFNTFVPVRLEMEGNSPESIGLIASALYCGILVGSLRIERWIGRVGHARAFAIFSMTTAIIVMMQSFWVFSWYWGILRFLGGICLAGIFVTIESWILMMATPTTRSSLFSVYEAVLFFALTVGQFLFKLADPSSTVPFSLTAFLCVAATLPLFMKKSEIPKLESANRISLIQVFQISPLGTFGAAVSGMVASIIYGLIPFYGAEIGLNSSQIGNLMAAIIFGGLIFQWPIGRIADRKNRRTVLFFVSLFAGCGSIGLSIFNAELFGAFLFAAFLFGGFCFTLYPICMAYTCQKLKSEQIVAATGAFFSAYGIGAIIGPIAAPFAMQVLGAQGIFYLLSMMVLFLSLCSIKKKQIENVQVNSVPEKKE